MPGLTQNSKSEETSERGMILVTADGTYNITINIKDSSEYPNRDERFITIAAGALEETPEETHEETQAEPSEPETVPEGYTEVTPDGSDDGSTISGTSVEVGDRVVGLNGQRIEVTAETVGDGKWNIKSGTKIWRKIPKKFDFTEYTALQTAEERTAYINSLSPEEQQKVRELGRQLAGQEA